ncbi:MAG TPA: FAD/NAD(P)-binding oxidoreductase [Campylobacterales bacterium]|nr:FAD/NAD(P)-binding oxidoreductase [Campylobacterales bacterium]
MRRDELFPEIETKVEEAVKKGELSRRDALKVLAFASGAAMMGNTALFAEGNETNATDVNATPKLKQGMDAKIVIIGGGSAGITVAARLVKADVKPENITLVEPSDKHVYQPGQTLVAGGIKTLESLIKNEADFVPSGVKWEKEKAVEFTPETNSLKLASGKTLTYDYLVVAAGLQYNFEKIKGLTADMIGKNDIHSIYDMNGAVAMWDAMQKLKGGTLLFSNPATPIKCGGAPQKIMYLTEDYMRSNGTRKDAKIEFMTAGGKYFGVPVYHDAVVGFVKEKEIVTSFNHNLVEVKAAEKIAIFEKKSKVKIFDKDLGEEVEQEKIELIEKKYDMLHIVPPMSPVSEIVKSPFVNNKGWMFVDPQTLQSKKFPNVFGIGDLIGTPFGKTGGSVRKQAPVLVENMIALMNSKEMVGKYSGYTVCPLITKRGTVMLAEFGYDDKQIAAKEPVTKAMAMPSFPLDPSQERWIWWIFKVYLLPPMYWHGMLRGRA